MSRKFKSQASSARAAVHTGAGFGSFQSISSPLSYVTEAPDLSQISDSNIVVAFKNLSKKDSVTKAKALQELQETFQGDVEQSILVTWCDIYPRTSIDNSRQVRQLAHTLQGTLTASSGKRIAPFLSKIIGSWLAGTFDSDTIVARVARDALEKSFPTQEKRRALWKFYGEAIQAYIQDAVTVQTRGTLSDERTTSEDDAEAKYIRVVGTAMLMLAQSLKENAENPLLAEKKLWEFAYHSEPYLRRASCTLARIASERHVEQLDWKVISTAFLSKGLQTDQTGSSAQFVDALLVLTQRRTELWTTDYTAKTPVTKRIQQFLKKGSQSGNLWSSLADLLQNIPEEVISKDSVIPTVEALRIGVSSERIDAEAAWTAYVSYSLSVVKKVDDIAEFLDQNLTPLVVHYVSRKGEQQWTVPTLYASRVSQKLLQRLAARYMTAFDTTWNTMIENIIDAMRLSAPESSKEFQVSQDAVIAQSNRLYGLKSSLVIIETVTIHSILNAADTKLLGAALELLRSRNGKPYCAAGIVEAIGRQPDFDSPLLDSFMNTQLPSLLDSPSSEKLTSLCVARGRTDVVESLLDKSSAYAQIALCHLLANTQTLGQTSYDGIRHRLTDIKSAEPLMLAIMSNASNDALRELVLYAIQQGLSPDSTQKSEALDVIEKLIVKPDMIAKITPAKSQESQTSHTSILSQLLVLSDMTDDIAERAQSLASMINSNAESTGSVQIVKQQLNGQGQLLAIGTLITLGQDLIHKNQQTINLIMPSEEQWALAIGPLLKTTRPYSLSITSPLQGIVRVIGSGTLVAQTTSGNHDLDGLSLLYRLVIFVTSLLKDEENIMTLVDEHFRLLEKYLPVAVQLFNEKLTVENANDLWSITTPNIISEASAVMEDSSRLVQLSLDNPEFTEYWLPLIRDDTLISNESPLQSYVQANAWIDVMSRLIGRHGIPQMLRDYDDEIKALHKSDNIIRSGALFAVFGDHLGSSHHGQRIFNELVADATDGKSSKPLVMTNILLSGQPDALDTIPPQRVVFLLKGLILQLEREEQEEVMRLLANIIPLVAEIYGEHWEQMIAHVCKVLGKGGDLSELNAALRLYSRLRTLLNREDINEDLQEAWSAHRKELEVALLDALQSLANFTLAIDQPRDITAQLLRRQICGVPLDTDIDVFGLLSSSVEAVQTTAYEALHQAIPLKQEKISLDLILEQTTISLSEELLSLLEDSTNPRQYLLAWNLAFDHFSTASFKLQEMYTSDLKKKDYVADLLAFVVDVLHITEKPIDASKFDIKSFEIDSGEADLQRETRWLAVHNYYSCLLYLPGLAKEWFISQKNRVKSPLEAWTQKYISPTIVAASCANVDAWAQTQSDEKTMTVKSSPKGMEMVASIEIDPENPPISLAIAIPPSYPLESPAVVPRNRVGVSEKNWQSWLRTFQIIIFSTGSIIEGLVAFRKNVQGALKGHSECAICYSIIGTDMQTPNKKCATCKNPFHGVCLFRWFKSSNSSSCPLCRNNFSYA